MQAESEKPIFANSLTRIILIDKSEYYLNYQHDQITFNKTNDPISLGRITLSPKTTASNSPLIQYQSQGDLLSTDTINQSLLANDPQLIRKIVLMIEGSLSIKQIYKIENSTFKIISNVKEGIHLIIFSCKLTQVNIESFDELFMNGINHFKKKKEHKDKLNELFKSQKTKEEEVNKVYTTLERDLKSKESVLLKRLSCELNKKKEQLRNLNKILNDDVEEIENKSMVLSRMASSKKNQEEVPLNPVSSLNLSLSDL